MEKIVRDEEWLKMKEEIHRQALEWKRMHEEEKKRGYSINVVNDGIYQIDKEGFFIIK
ncbi:hypothetical protein GKG47_17705 [Lactonifactor sp. BIOML-A3]|uniref:hypothetical protein n=1 Tax=unclassified Lactonifactor TaxID=2636670 RepID=UPI0012B11D36|nr:MULTISPECIES: hypothetical protein [unclassified Lactonifactor]MSA03372.1 hypothetical protein [Lactonifactor sp. BIOML-A5]MSA09721.1 hypothetical protein [Lactonifactor sp. BIOML-A4]MSA14263.1 hypothetical protein [Lactonifactor sp. BIOML-A3]MSA18726.1 hypothetical protein [Lactonifactor sp. BIOML-A2]MSA39508.1 hypothetical protein [Lactonifactor sp. BIOML-A1]